MGWVQRRRNHGGVIFVDLRDREGITQVVFNPEVSPKVHKKAHVIRSEYVIGIRGNVEKRLEGMTNPKLKTGEIEVFATELKILNSAEPPPFMIEDNLDVSENIRLKFRHIDLRRPLLQKNIIQRHTAAACIRQYLNHLGFIDIETPVLTRSTPEGARDYLVPSRVHQGHFYALPQSPQLFKQLMMAGGFEKVFEIGPIFRAEEHDTRRHLNEATSIDIEQSFADHEDVMGVLERLVSYVYERIGEDAKRWLDVLNITLTVPEVPFVRLTYDEALEIAKKAEPELCWGDDLTTQSEKTIGAELGEHYFIVDWPTQAKPYYAMPYEHKPEISKSFDLMHPAMELASGSQRIHQHELLRRMIASKGLEPESFEFYLRAFRYGMPPHAGWGMGVERLLMTMLALDNIRECVLFPRDRRRLSP